MKIQSVAGLCIIMASILSCPLIGATDTTLTGKLDVLSAIRLNKESDLRFGEVIRPIKGSTYAVIAPDASGAAVFKASGEKLKRVRAYVTTPSIFLTNTQDPGRTVKVTQFNVGGALANDGTGAGSGAFDNEGRLSNIRVGARAQVTADTKTGAYVGAAALRLVYE